MTSSASPLFDTLFRPTIAAEPAAPETRPDGLAGLGASAAPIRVPGTRTRAGNAMNRTRAALLLGAGRAVAATGTKIAMAQVATLAGVAKATLYNHFRTRDAVLAALLLDQVQQLVDAHQAEPLEVALAGAARDIARNEVVRGLAVVEPAALAAIARIDDAAPAWTLARSAVADLLAGAGRGGADTVLRWLASFLLSPASPDIIAADVAVLVAGLPLAAPVESDAGDPVVARPVPPVPLVAPTAPSHLA